MNPFDPSPEEMLYELDGRTVVPHPAVCQAVVSLMGGFPPELKEGMVPCADRDAGLCSFVAYHLGFHDDSTTVYDHTAAFNKKFRAHLESHKCAKKSLARYLARVSSDHIRQNYSEDPSSGTLSGYNFCSNPKCTAPTSKKPKMCAACRTVFYCSKACQKQHWKAGHKADCTQRGDSA
jgi:hypothetical protein